MDNFEKASRLKLRFDISGSISTEQLWDIKLPHLIDYEQRLTEVVEGYAKSTRRNRTRKTNEQLENELRLSLVTYVLDVREAEAEEAKQAAENKAHNQKILELIQSKKENELASKSVEELEAMLK
jgi:hypothetical protein